MANDEKTKFVLHFKVYSIRSVFFLLLLNLLRYVEVEEMYLSPYSGKYDRRAYIEIVVFVPADGRAKRFRSNFGWFIHKQEEDDPA